MGITRRHSLRQLMKGGFELGVLAAVLPSAISPAAKAAAPKDALSLPKAPMRLTRTLTRDLRGWAQLRVSRAWQVDFAHKKNGIFISGIQTSARVDAPPQLAQLAELEEERDTSGTFPILLSENGLIIASGSSMRSRDVNEAVRRADNMISNALIPDDEKARHQLHLAQLQRSGASFRDPMPSDLFFPSGKSALSREEITLPGGLRGEFEMRYEAFVQPGNPWLHHASREVVTRIGGGVRRSIEEWGLEPLSHTSR